VTERFKVRRGVILGALSMTVIGLASVAPAPAMAQGTASATRQFDIPAQSLREALMIFGQQSGIQVTAQGPLVEGRTSTAVSGNLAPAEALSRLLTGTGLTFRFDGRDAVRIEPAPEVSSGAISLGPVRVEGVSEQAFGPNGADTDPLLTEGTGSYAPRAVSIGGKTPRDPREIQQSVSVLTAQRIQDQNLTDVSAALNEITGVTLVSHQSRSANIPTPFSRGFAITSLQFDGGSPAFLSTFPSFGLPDLAIYDHVEVLRGSDGLFSGAGEAGGTINVVRKRPLDHGQIIFEALAGSWRRYRAQIDVTGPLGFDGKLRGRVVAAYEDRHFFYDTAKLNKTVLYGVVEADLSPSTLLTLGGVYERRDEVPFSTGIPRYADGGDLGLPRSTCFCTPWGQWKESTPELFAKLEQSLGADWTLKINLSQQRKRIDTRYVEAYAFAPIDPASGYTGELYGNGENGVLRQRMGDVTLNGSFDLLGMRQEILLGASWQRFDYDGLRYYSLDAVYRSIDVFDFNPRGIPDPGDPVYPFIIYHEGGQEQAGVYGTWRWSITGRLHALLGGRYSDYRFRQVGDFFDTVTGAITFQQNQNYKQSGVFTPYGGLSWDISQAISAYFSYAEIFKPQGNTFDSDLNVLKPITGSSYELGAKASWLDGRLTASLAGYIVKRRNEAVLAFQHPSISGCCYTASAEIQSKGIDAELTGELLPGWQVSAGYTFNRNDYEFGYGANEGMPFMPQTPRHLFKFWTMIDMGGGLSGFRLGGGVNAQSKSYVTGTFGDQSFRATQGGYAIVSLRGEYRIGDHWTAAVNVDNVFDKRYYQTVASPYSGSAYGEPANVLFSVRGNW